MLKSGCGSGERRVDLPSLEQFEGPLDETSYLRSVVYSRALDSIFSNYYSFLPSSSEVKDQQGLSRFR